MDERGQRIGINEALFRQVNERLEDLNEVFSTFTGTMSVVCECGELECVEHLTIAAQEYEWVRNDPTQFVIVPGHEEPDVEDVVERNRGYDVVRKRAGGAAEAARQLDPRGRQGER